MSVTDQLFSKIPHQCLLCKTKSDKRVCTHCQKFFDPISSACVNCGIPLKVSLKYCGACVKTPPNFDEVVAAYLYKPPLSILINRYKKQRDCVAGEHLKAMLTDAIRNHYQHQENDEHSLPSAVVAVPMAPLKQFWRGFNHTIPFAESIAQDLGLNTLSCVTCKNFWMQDQKSLKRKQRLENVANSFVVKNCLRGLDIAIVDDVMTTGATVNGLAKALKQAGANRVLVWVLARTPL